MRGSRRLATVLLAVATLAGCGTAANLGAGAKPRPHSSSARSGSGTSAGSTQPTRQGQGQASGTAKGPKRQLGIDLDYYVGSPRDNVAALAAADVAYVKSLHANALAVSFPFFMHGPKVNAVYANSKTPTPADLAILAVKAERAGLYVSIRPLLDEPSLHYPGGRTKWTPTNMAAWFASYEQFLKPYAQMAQRVHIPEMFTGVEFNTFYLSPYWNKLDAFLRRYYHGTLAYSNSRNWAVPRARVNKDGVVQGVDSYKPIRLPDNATVAALTRAWDRYLSSGANQIVISEMGISAQYGAYGKPYRVNWFGGPLEPIIQVNWFTAACNAAATHDDSLYFWSIFFENQFHQPPTTSYPASFIDSPGAAAIAACFKRPS